MSRPTDPVCERGVYKLRHRSRCGHPILVAVDSSGRELTRAVVFRGEDEKTIAQMLYNILDQADPVT